MLPGARSQHGQLYVTGGVPLTTDPRLSGFALKPTGEVYASISGGNVWSPAELFMEGEQGAWYDPSDLSTMFQDSAGTIPVTADGQPVGLILDKSGNNNRASQATAAARPLYKTDGTYHWLQFDGVDDFFQVANIGTNALISMFVGMDYVTVDPLSMATGTANASTTAFVNGTAQITAGNGVTSNVDFLRTPKFVGTLIFDGPSNSGVAHRNGADLGIAPITGGVGGSAMSLLSIGVNTNGVGNFTAMTLFSLIVRGALSSPQEITNTETWTNGKTGAY